MSVRSRAGRAFWSTPIGVLSACLLAAVVIGGGAALILRRFGPAGGDRGAGAGPGQFVGLLPADR